MDENLGFIPEGEGEHIYLHVKKRGMNTQWLVKNVSKFAKIKERDIGFCGMKDRYAITTQWLSLYMPKKTPPDWKALEANPDLDISILDITKGPKKLRRGQHQNNNFKIVLKNFVAPSEDELESLLCSIQQKGVPNYFGEQRFGRGGNNLINASKWLDDGRRIETCGPKGIIMSAARSYIFNLYLAERVTQNNWAEVIPGDVKNQQEQPEGPMWGRGKPARTDLALEIQNKVLEGRDAWLNGLEHCGLNQEGRSLVLKPQNFAWEYQDQTLTLVFELLPGQYATTILGEIATLTDCSAAPVRR